MSTAPATPRAPTVADAPEVAWQRLNARMILVDALRVLVSLLPAAVAILMLDVEITPATIWPVVTIAAWGVVSSANDVLRWIKTRYRITDDYVERRTGLIVRKYRSIRRDRIRSVDSAAKLRHRLAGLRLVTIGAGQQNTAFEAALSLDAVSKQDAEWLRRDLMGEWQSSSSESEATEDSSQPGEPAAGRVATEDQVFATIQYRWIIYNLFNVWAYVMAIGVLWGGYFLATTFGLDPWTFVTGLLDWQALGWIYGTLLVLLAVGALGVAGLAITFVTGHWNFRLVRTRSQDGTVLRTTQGLLHRQEVNRDDKRLRGAEISEPLLWRWMGMADTNVITTGLSVWSEAPTILPRGPISVARPVVRAVLGEQDSPLDAPLRRHPPAALRRRVLWASLLTGLMAALLAWFSATDTGVAASAWAWTVLIMWPVTLLLAMAAYRALGHAFTGAYVVLRSGMMARSTAALQRRATSGIAVRQSVLQRRLGLATVSVTTAAGQAIYEAPDVAAAEAVSLAEGAAPGILEEFLVRD